ncbi:MAG: class I SAM-dependent methyltransferase [Pseudomonadota bacterium]
MKSADPDAFTHISCLTGFIDLAGKSVVDIGAGTGGFCRQLHAEGALATGIEISAEKVATASQDLPDGIVMREGIGEALPLADDSQDVVCFIFSLHHVPVDGHDQALAEAARVLRQGGRLHVVEPKVSGTMFEVVKLIDDETSVRTAARHRMEAMSKQEPFQEVGRRDYAVIRTLANFQAFIDRVVGVDPTRAAAVPGVRDELSERFHRLALRTANGYRLEQPCTAYHFRLAPI